MPDTSAMLRRNALALALALMACPPALQAQTVTTPEEATTTVSLRQVQVTGVGLHQDQRISPDGIDALANAALLEIGGTLPAQLDFAQLQQLADRITAAYRQAGFLVALAYLPPQDIDSNGTLRIQVIEGTVGRVLVRGSQRYRDDQLAASSLPLIGRPLRQQELERAIGHARDLPGVSISPALQPGEHTGETDIVLFAEDAERPYEISAGLSNHGTDSTGRYRAELGINAFNMLGAGDLLSASVGYGLNPADSWQANVGLSIPSRRISGLSGTLGFSRSELELNTGPIAPLDIHGPTTVFQVGGDWTSIPHPDLWLRTSARWIHEESRLDGLGIELSWHKFDVLETSVALRHLDRSWRGLNIAQASIRKSIGDGSPAFNWLYAAHESYFLIGRLSLTRLQALPGHQRIVARASAQFTRDALAPIEQFSIGGPNSVRAFPLSSGLGDRGVQATLEYQIDAPGFDQRPSPFQGRTWGELLTLSVFYDWGRASPAHDARQRGALPITLEGAGVGVDLRLPWQPDLRLNLSAATPTGRTKPDDGDDLQVWARIGMTF